MMCDTVVKALTALMVVELRLKFFCTSGLHDVQVRWLENTRQIASDAIAECQSIESAKAGEAK